MHQIKELVTQSRTKRKIYRVLLLGPSPGSFHYICKQVSQNYTIIQKTWQLISAEYLHTNSLILTLKESIIAEKGYIQNSWKSANLLNIVFRFVIPEFLFSMATAVVIFSDWYSLY